MGMAGEVPAKPRIFLAAWFVLSAIVWVFVPTSFARGIVFGAALAPVVIVGTLMLYGRVLGRREAAQPFPARVPVRSWEHEIEAVSLDGDRLSGADLEGRVAVLSYWPATGDPDFGEVARLARLRTATEDLPVDVLCLAERSEEELAALLGERGELGVPVYRFEGRPPMGYRDLPMGMTFVVGPTGVITAQSASVGIWDDDAVVAFVRSLATGVTE